ncbi:MAG: hypothetical protein LUC17_01345, partial [Oscillospiraceae bacterium]|nr:hypothetical protein [Oscillospiraceae bacterium]
MKIKCAKRFNDLDSMIEDMENVLDNAEVESSEDVCSSDNEICSSDEDDVCSSEDDSKICSANNKVCSSEDDNIDLNTYTNTLVQSIKDDLIDTEYGDLGLIISKIPTKDTSNIHIVVFVGDSTTGQQFSIPVEDLTFNLSEDLDYIEWEIQDYLDEWV